MEFFTVSCLRRGRVSVDGLYQGENKTGGTLKVFQCRAGLHDVSLECKIGQKCREMTQRVLISGTNAIVPLVIGFVCEVQDGSDLERH
uniref:PEGA domain-containing protein n=1 Tax=Geobacter sp. (strain M21) TaxID=443144 RepID=C6E1K6_GEOSM